MYVKLYTINDLLINTSKIRYEYSNSILSKESYYGIGNEPVNAYDNLSTIKYEYLDYRNITNLIKDDTIKIKNIVKHSFYDKNDNPIILKKENYHSIYIGYDNNNEIIIYCDTNNKLIINENKIAYEIISYGGKINSDTRIYKVFGVNNEPILDMDNRFKMITKFNGLEFYSVEYFDTNEKPITNIRGYHKFLNDYDENLNCISHKLYSTNNQLTLSSMFNYAIIYWQYDKNNREIYIQYLGTNEEPIMSIDGYSSYKINYDENGTSTTNYYDDKGNEININ